MGTNPFRTLPKGWSSSLSLLNDATSKNENLETPTDHPNPAKSRALQSRANSFHCSERETTSLPNERTFFFLLPIRDWPRHFDHPFQLSFEDGSHDRN